MTNIAAHASPLTRFLKSERFMRWLKTYGIGVAMGIFLSLVGAMQTQDLPLFKRLFYWVFTMLCGTAIAHVTTKVLDRASFLKLWQEILLMFIIITCLISVFIWAFTAYYFSFELHIKRLVFYLIPVGIISIAMTGLHFMADQIPHQSHEIAQPVLEVYSPNAKLMTRLDDRFKDAEIFAVSSEDHYLRVYTSSGEALILMRLYDAIEELEGIEGSQVHRSWWVAKNAIAEAIKQEGRPAFRLKNNQTVPISRTFLKALRGNGWI